MSSFRKRERSFRQNSAVNVTPLVDVMLVLLIIFMVTAPMMTVGVKVDLPQTSAAQLNNSGDPLVVTIDASGDLFLQETRLSRDDLGAKLAAVLAANKDACVYVRADKNLRYATVMDVMGFISECGITKVSLIGEAVPTKAKA